MEPSSAEDGDLLQVVESCHAVIEASMEPSSAEDGDFFASGGEGDILCASMEPSSAEDGDGKFELHSPNQPNMLQWSRPQLRTETGRS